MHSRSTIAVSYSESSLQPRAVQLAQTWGFLIAESTNAPGTEFLLRVTPERLELVENRRNAPLPVAVDFLGGSVGHRRQFDKTLRGTVAQAVGLWRAKKPTWYEAQAATTQEAGSAKTDDKLRILDATAGLGRDAFFLADHGAIVLGLERNPVMAALLVDGLARALADAELGFHLGGRLTFRHADARQTLAALPPADYPDVIYLDPMYPEKRKASALPSKEMQVLRRVAGDDKDAEELLVIALTKARRRVVVKRPSHAEPLAGRPDLAVNSAKTRYDIYFTADRPAS